MKLELNINGQNITVTTEHSASSYNQPVVLINGKLTDYQSRYDHDDDECKCSALGLLADAAGIWNGPYTRQRLRDLAAEMLPQNPSGADYDKVIAEFKRREKDAE